MKLMDSRNPILTIACNEFIHEGGSINRAARHRACMSQSALADVLGRTDKINQSTSSQFIM